MIANGFSRQLVYKKRNTLKAKEQVDLSTVSQVLQVRKKHKNRGPRVMYHHFESENLGINKLERILSNNGLSVAVKKRRIATTTGVYEKSDQNLLNGLLLNDINQVIAGDITYLMLKHKTYYIITQKDRCSKRIVGLYASENMFAIHAITTL